MADSASPPVKKPYMPPIYKLPLEIFLDIYDYLRIRDLQTLRLVSHVLASTVIPTLAKIYAKMPLEESNFFLVTLSLQHARFLTTRYALETLHALTCVPKYRDYIKRVTFRSAMSYLQDQETSKPAHVKIRKNLLDMQRAFEESGNMARLLAKIFTNLKDATQIESIDADIHFRSEERQTGRCFGVANLKTRLPFLSEIYRPYRPASTSLNDLSVLLNAFKSSGLSTKASFSLTITPSMDALTSRKIQEQAVRLLGDEDSSQNITHIRLLDSPHSSHPSYRAVHRQYIHPLQPGSTLQGLKCLEIVGNQDAVCFEHHENNCHCAHEHVCDDQLRYRWKKKGEKQWSIEKLRRFDCLRNLACNGCVDYNDALRSIVLPSLVRLDISRTHLDGESLTEFLSKHSQKLTSLRLEHCALTNGNWLTILRALAKEDTKTSTKIHLVNLAQIQHARKPRYDSTYDHEEKSLSATFNIGESWAHILDTFDLDNIRKRECNALDQKKSHYIHVLFPMGTGL